MVCFSQKTCKKKATCAGFSSQNPTLLHTIFAAFPLVADFCYYRNIYNILSMFAVVNEPWFRITGEEVRMADFKQK